MTAPLPPPSIPISWGELLDKLTILRIKRVRIADAGARANVEREQALLARAAAPVLAEPAIAELMAALHAVNAALWEVEDGLREHEAAADFGAEFVALARAVYRHNDERAALKRRINTDLRSELVEEKWYSGAAGVGATAP